MHRKKSLFLVIRTYILQNKNENAGCDGALIHGKAVLFNNNLKRSFKFFKWCLYSIYIRVYTIVILLLKGLQWMNQLSITRMMILSYIRMGKRGNTPKICVRIKPIKNNSSLLFAVVQFLYFYIAELVVIDRQCLPDHCCRRHNCVCYQKINEKLDRILEY